MIKFMLAILLFATVTVKAQKVMLMTDETTDVTFVTKHLAGRLEGTFRGINGTAGIDSNNLSTSFFKLAFATATILQNDYQLGPNLLKADCLNPTGFPVIELSSTGIVKLPGANQYQFNGTLTVKGISKSVTFPFTAIPNYGGYDFNFKFPIVKKVYNLECGINKQFNISVKGYGKIM